MTIERPEGGRSPPRSQRPEVRNPVLALPSFQVLAALDPTARAALATLLRDLSRDARTRAADHGRRRKAFVAAYWATIAVYAGHIARALDRRMTATSRHPRRDGEAERLEQGRYCVLSTGHLTATTGALLDEWASWPPTDRPIDIAASVYGWFVPTRPIDEKRRDRLPQDLLNVIAFGRAQGCHYVLLDCDGAENDMLPRHHW